MVDEIIQIRQEVIEMTPSGHRDRAWRLQALAAIYQIKYSLNKTICHLTTSIRLYHDALDLAPASSQFRPMWLYMLALVYEDRNQRMRSDEDFEKAFQLYQEALETMSLCDPDRHFVLRGLGRWHLRKASSRTDTHLDKAIRLFQECADNEDHVNQEDRASSLHLLSEVHEQKFLWQTEPKDMSDIDEAIKACRQALDMLPLDSPSLPHRLAGLGSLQKLRYLYSKEMADFEAAKTTFQQLFDKSSPDHGLRAFWLTEYIAIFDRNDAAIAPLLLEAANHPKSPVSARLRACGYLLDYCERNPAWKQAYECACMTVDLLQSCAPLFLETSDKQINLRHFDYYGLACEAAIVALRSGKGALKALQLLERGRGVLSASLENVRMDSPDLRQDHPDLAKRFLRLRSELQLPMPTDAELLDKRVERRQEVAEAFDKVVAEIRQLPGFENFQLPPSEAEIYSAAQDGPIVVILVGYWSSDALLIERDQVRALRLPDLKSRETEMRRRSSENVFGDAETLEWLWDTVAAPVLHALGFTQSPADDNWPHVWWILTSVLSHFPIHAAGYHGKGKQSSETVLEQGHLLIQFLH